MAKRLSISVQATFSKYGRPYLHRRFLRSDSELRTGVDLGPRRSRLGEEVVQSGALFWLCTSVEAANARVDETREARPPFV